MRFQCRCSADAVPMQCVYNTNAIRKDCRLRTMIPKLGRSAMYWEEYSNTFTLLKDTFAAATTPRPLTVSVAWKLQGHYCSDTPQPCSTPSDSVVMITSVSVYPGILHFPIGQRRTRTHSCLLYPCEDRSRSVRCRRVTMRSRPE